MRLVVTGSVLVCLLLPLEARLAYAEQPERFDGHRVVSVTVEDEAQLAELLALTDDVWSHGVGIGRVDVRLTPDQFGRLQASALRYEVMIEDLGPLVTAQLARPRGATFHESYHTYDEIVVRLQEFGTNFPDIVEVISFGTSLEGRDLTGLRITGVGAGATKPAFFFNGGQHAREWVSPATMMYLADWLVSSYGTDDIATRLIDDVEWFILPVMNPDGYVWTWTDNRMWRKNRRDNGDDTVGVDLNRNWGYEWGGNGSSGNPSSSTYRGPEPFSEPETQAMRDFILAHPNIVAYIDYHSYSELILWPWGYTGDLCPDDDEFAYVGLNMRDRTRPGLPGGPGVLDDLPGLRRLDGLGIRGEPRRAADSRSGLRAARHG